MDYRTEEIKLTPALQSHIKTNLKNFCESDVLRAIQIHAKNFLKESIEYKDIQIPGFKLDLRLKRVNDYNVLVGFRSFRKN